MEKYKTKINREIFLKIHKVLTYFFEKTPNIDTLLRNAYIEYLNKDSNKKVHLEKLDKFLKNKVKLISILARNEVDKLIKVGIIYKQFNQNFMSFFKKIIEAKTKEILKK